MLGVELWLGMLIYRLLCLVGCCFLGMGLWSLAQTFSLRVFGIWTFWNSGPAPWMDRSPCGTMRCEIHKGLRPRMGGAHFWEQGPTQGHVPPDHCWALASKTSQSSAAQHMVSWTATRDWEQCTPGPEGESCCKKRVTLKPIKCTFQRGWRSVYVTILCTNKEKGNSRNGFGL